MIEKIISSLRENPAYTDPQVEALHEKFADGVFMMNREEQEQFIRLYARHIAGVEVPQAWQENRAWSDAAGKNLNGVGEQPPEDGATFWQELKISIPWMLTPEENAWLVANDPKGSGGFDLLCLMSSFSPKTPLATRMITVIHTWK